MSRISVTSSVKKNSNHPADDILHHAFNDAANACIISVVSSGKIIIANTAACRLLGYSRKELLTKSHKSIFDIKETGFREMQKQSRAVGHSSAIVTIIKKKGTHIPCEITSSVFADETGIEKSITSITDISKKLLGQKKADAEKEKVIAGNILVARSVQKKIDIQKEKIVAKDIRVAKKKQKDIDVKKEKLVAGNIILAEAEHKKAGIKKDKVVAANLVVAESKQKKADIKKEKKVADNILLAKSKQKEIDIKKDKIVAENIILAQDKSNATLAESNKWIKHIAKTSYDVMWDWDVVTGDVYVGDSIKEIFGYSVKNNMIRFSEFKEFLDNASNGFEEKVRAVIASGSKTWSDSYHIKRKDGTMACVNSRASIVRDDTGKAIRLIGATQDVSRLQELEIQLEELNTTVERSRTESDERFRLMFNSSSDVLYDIDLSTDEIVINEAYHKEFGHPVTPHMKTGDVWGRHIHPDDREAVLLDYHRMLASADTEWKSSYRLLRADGSVANVSGSRIIMRNAGGIAFRMIGSIQNISKQKVLEEKLEQEIKLKEKQIADAMEDAKEAERSDIGKELHDNVNQLLGVSRLYLEMAKQGGKNSFTHLSRSSEYTLSAIEEIRKLTKGLTTDAIKHQGLINAIHNLAVETMQITPLKISCLLDSFREDTVNDKFKLNVYRVIQEQLNNILKHAEAKKVVISLSQNKKSIALAVSDDGVGFDTSQKRKGIGVDNIKSRAAVYNGTADFVSQPGKGCVLNVRFSISPALIRN